MDPLDFFKSDSEKTYQYDDDLPPLPLPPLHQSLKRYLDSVKPLVSEREYENTEKIVKMFEQGQGVDLYQKLIHKAKTTKNWLEKWWEKIAYLDNRVAISNTIVAGPGPFMYHYLPAREGVQIETAGLVTYYALKYWQLMKREELRPNRDRKGRVLTMHQHRLLFNTCRIPGVETDNMKYYFKTEREGQSPSHLVVMCKGRIFKFDAVDDKGQILSPLEIRQQLQYITNTCDSVPEGPGIGSMTSNKRTSWAQMRNRLLDLHPDNYVALETIQSALFVIVIDDNSPVDETDIMREALTGECLDKWFDKSFNLIFHKNGLVGMTFDHTPFDGMVQVSLISFIDFNVLKCKGKWQGCKKILKLPYPEEIVFHIDDIIMKGISTARQEHLKFVNSLECSMLYFRKFGKDFLGKHKIHPDVFIQMALQLTYYRKHKCPAPTYETAATRRFWHGRTETVRSCSKEAVNWCEAMLDETLSNQRKLQLLHIAMEKHLELTHDAKENHGCDRLLLGLAMQAQEDGLATPNIFLDPAFTKSGGGGNFKLSTSFAGETAAIGACSPMCRDGYALFYKILDSHFGTLALAWRSDTSTSASGFNHLLHQTLVEMRSLIDHSMNDISHL